MRDAREQLGRHRVALVGDEQVGMVDRVEPHLMREAIRHSQAQTGTLSDAISRNHRIGMVDGGEPHRSLPFRAITRHQEVIRRSSGGHQEVIRRSSGGHPEVIRRSSGGHPEVIRRSSGGEPYRSLHLPCLEGQLKPRERDQAQVGLRDRSRLRQVGVFVPAGPR